MIVTTTASVKGYEIREYIGIAKGISIRTPTPGQNGVGGIKAWFGGSNNQYADMCEDNHTEAYQRMCADATTVKADAIIGVAYTNTTLARIEGSIQTVCYGTAVKLTKITKAKKWKVTPADPDAGRLNPAKP